jgi:hypothetical protein
MKYTVNIYGKIPDCLELEAGDADQAVEMALEDVIDRLEFKAAPSEGWPICATPKRANNR